jgi:hypothetical protein
MFVQFMFRHRFSKGVEDDELLGLVFALLLNKKVSLKREALSYVAPLY